MDSSFPPYFPTLSYLLFFRPRGKRKLVSDLQRLHTMMESMGLTPTNSWLNVRIRILYLFPSGKLLNTGNKSFTIHAVMLDQAHQTTLNKRYSVQRAGLKCFYIINEGGPRRYKNLT